MVRKSYITYRKLVTVILLWWLLGTYLTVNAQEFTTTIDFERYADGTPISSIVEPYVAFTVNGTAQILNHQLEVEAGSTIMIKFSEPASHIQLSVAMTGNCITAKAPISIVDTSGFADNRASLNGVYYCETPDLHFISDLVNANKFIVSLPGPSTRAYKISFDDITIKFKTRPQKQAVMGLETPQPLPTLTPQPLETTDVPGQALLGAGKKALITDLDGKSVALFLGADLKSAVIEYVPPNTVVTLTNGPLIVGNLRWWHIESDWGTGWVLEKITLNNKQYLTLVSLTPSLLAQRVIDYTAVLDRSPNAVAHANLGQAYRNNEQWDAAGAAFTKAVQLDSKDAVICYQAGHMFKARGEAFWNTQDSTRAIDMFSLCISLDPKRAAFYVSRGAVNAKLGNYEAALADYNKAITLNKNNTSAFNNRGNIYSDLNKISEAEKDYDHVIELDPYYAFAYSNKGVMYWNLAQYVRAIDSYKKAIEVYPSYTSFYSNLATLLCNYG